MTVHYGKNRLVVGAHYGFGDWLMQRITAGLMLIFTLVLIVQVLMPGSIDYFRWADIFSSWWMKGLTFVTMLSLTYHAWVGVRDIWMDYIKPVWLRVALHTATAVWLLGCLGWLLQVLWRL